MTWVFGYGSLMWRPGFPYLEKHPATLRDYHRAFCRYSIRHRGTPERPGMVVGLLPGGVTRGYAILPDPDNLPFILDYLDEREGSGYHRARHPLEIDKPSGTVTEEGWIYVPDESHSTCVTDLPRERMVELIATGRGISGTAHEYLVDLIRQLDDLDIEDPELNAMLREVERYQAEAGRQPA